jgi:hypothetical protein
MLQVNQLRGFSRRLLSSAPVVIEYVTTVSSTTDALQASGGTAGDLIIGVAYGAATTPSLPASGWTNIANTDGGGASIRAAWRIYATEASHTWTNATDISYHLYRNCHATVPIGNTATSTANNASTWTVPTITVSGSPNSWVFWACSAAPDGVGAPGIPSLPASNASRHNFTNAASTIGRAGDTNAAVSSFAATTGSMPSNQDTAQVVIELLRA